MPWLILKICCLLLNFKFGGKFSRLLQVGCVYSKDCQYVTTSNKMCKNLKEVSITFA